MVDPVSSTSSLASGVQASWQRAARRTGGGGARSTGGGGACDDGGGGTDEPENEPDRGTSGCDCCCAESMSVLEPLLLCTRLERGGAIGAPPPRPRPRSEPPRPAGGPPAAAAAGAPPPPAAPPPRDGGGRLRARCSPAGVVATSTSEAADDGGDGCGAALAAGEAGVGGGACAGGGAPPAPAFGSARGGRATVDSEADRFMAACWSAGSLATAAGRSEPGLLPPPPPPPRDGPEPAAPLARPPRPPPPRPRALLGATGPAGAEAELVGVEGEGGWWCLAAAPAAGGDGGSCAMCAMKVADEPDDEADSGDGLLGDTRCTTVAAPAVVTGTSSEALELALAFDINSAPSDSGGEVDTMLS